MLASLVRHWLGRQLLDSHLLCWPDRGWLLGLIGLRRLSPRRCLLAVFFVWEELESDNVWSSGHSGFGDAVPLRIGGAFVIEVSISDVLVLDDVFADVDIVVVAFVTASPRLRGDRGPQF